jgi:hypothetical protein
MVGPDRGMAPCRAHDHVRAACFGRGHQCSALDTCRGVLHTGAVPAVPGTKAGTSVQIWIDAAGKAQQPPLTSSQLSARVALATAAAPLAVALGMLLGWCGLRWLLDRRRLAAWGESWSLAGPSWTR